MNQLVHVVPLSLLVISLAACGTSSPPSPTPTSLFASPQPAAASATAQGSASAVPAVDATPSVTSSDFGVAVIVDTTSEQVTREQAAALIGEASGYLHEFSPFALEMIDFAEDGGGGSTTDMAGRYVAARSASLPNGLVIFSGGDQGRAKAEGGYGYSLPVLGGFKNTFVSPSAGESQIYVAVVDYGYKYMGCGYGGADQVQSTSSLPGECRGQNGMACVPSNGYSMCADAVGHLYTTTRTHASASMIVHGLLDSFGPGEQQNQYSSPECSTRMGYPAGFFDLQQSQYYNGLCPFVYEEFTKSHRP